jgi:hypothetical protein
MKRPQVKLIVSATLTAMAIAYGPIVDAYDGDDGEWTMKNISWTPYWPTEFANVQMARFYVPSQDRLGNLVPVVYKKKDGTVVMTRTDAKPLVAAFNDGSVVDPVWQNPVTGEEFEPAFSGHGKRDVFSSISLDDGNTWNRYNLSVSGNSVVGPIFVKDHTGKYVCSTKSAQDDPTVAFCDYFYYGDSPETPDPTPRDINPVTGRYEIDDQHLVEEVIAGGGDVVNVNQVVIGNNILVSWVSRMCTGGVSPLDAVEAGGTNPYEVLGRQNYVDYSLFKAEGEIGTSMLQAIREIGKVPYGCLWTKRGRFVEDAGTGKTSIQWWPNERLTSGVRDPWKIEIAGTENAGFAVVWQEDPDGLLPGSGEGPGEGWSGSTVNHKTDVWYSYLHLKDFANSGPVMSVPVPITDNAKCPLNSGEQGKQWCYADNMTFDKSTRKWTAGADGTPDYCADGDLVYNSCIAQDGRFMEGQTGASRPRMNLQAYCVGEDIANWGSCTNWSAWAAISYEESKGKGDLVDENGKTLETGKNIRLATFDFQQPEPVKQHLQLNSPTRRHPGVNWASLPYIYNSGTPGVVPDTVNPAQSVYDKFVVYRPNLFNISIWNAPFFDTEIARRASITSQGVKAAYESTNGTALLGMFKQGIMNQGGPADIMYRRFVLTDPLKRPTFNPGSDNPFSVMACGRWATDTELGVLNNPDMPGVNGLRNPNYQDGLCLEPPINASATIPETCDGTTTPDWTGTSCGYKNTNPNLENPYAVIKRTFTWTQPQGTDSVDKLVDDRTTLDDESWYNPWDVAKGHRGILDGDFAMIQFAWAPNYVANKIGRDKYDLYARRSFDGGKTFTTTPNDPKWTTSTVDGMSVTADGSYHCETYRAPVTDDGNPAGLTIKFPISCLAYAAGAPERARNLSLITTRTPEGYPSRTVLDPRYTSAGGLFKHASTAFKLSGTSLVAQAPHTDTYNGKAVGGDLRDRSLFFIAYDDGDNTTVDFGEAEPVDMFYAQAYNWGDEYTGIYRNVCQSTGVNCVTTVVMEQLNAPGTNAAESSITANPDGTFLYSTWNEWRWSTPGDYESNQINEDAMFRRLMLLDGE